MSETKRVIFDIDDVLMPWAELVHNACIAEGIAPADSIWKQWEMWLDYPNGTKEDWLRIVDSLVVPDGVYHGEPYPGAVEAVRKLVDANNEAYFVTARGFFAHSDQIRLWTFEWIEKHFPFVPITHLGFAKDKGVAAKIIGATHAIDDRFDNVLTLNAAGVNAYLMNQPHNASVVYPDDRRVNHVAEFVERIL